MQKVSKGIKDALASEIANAMCYGVKYGDTEIALNNEPLEDTPVTISCNVSLDWQADIYNNGREDIVDNYYPEPTINEMRIFDETSGDIMQVDEEMAKMICSKIQCYDGFQIAED